MFSIEPFSTLPMSDDGDEPRTASVMPVVVFMNNKTLTFPLKINKALELSLNQNTILEFTVRR